MRKLLFSLLLVLLAPTLVSGIGVPSSGIDWSNSTMIIEQFAAAHPSHEGNFNCFGSSYTDLPITVNLDQMAFSEVVSGPAREKGLIASQSCFQQAGLYEVSLTLVDQVGNVGLPVTYTLRVKAGPAGSLRTTLEPISYTKETNNPAVGALTGNTNACNDERLIANNADECGLRLSLRDDFGNVVVLPTAVGNLSVPGRDTDNQDLNLIEAASEVFVDGLRFDGDLGDLPVSTDRNGNFDFTVSALVPSLEILTSAVNPTFNLSRILPRPVQFEFPVPEVGENGDFLATTTLVNKSADLQFEPWVKFFLSDRPATGGSATEPTDPLFFLLGESKPLYGVADTLLDHFLPDGFEIFVKSFNRPVGLFFEDEDLTNGVSDIDGDTVPEGLQINFAGNARNQSDDFETALKSTVGLAGDENVALGSKIRHSFVEEGITKTVLYPGGNLGSFIGPEEAFPGVTLPDSSLPGGQAGTATALLIGADIEGKILTNSDIRLVDAASTELVNLGGVSVPDVREDVLRNATVLTRGLAPLNAEGSNINFNPNTGFTGGDVAYFKDTTVTLTTGSNPMIFAGGIKTIVIEDGNLFIPNDLQYSSFDDSLGIIMVNTQAEAVETGNIFVKNTVQRLVGTYYADGALLSTDAITNPRLTDTIANRELTNVDDPAAPLGLQLLLEGTLLTRNTLGGALLDPPRTAFAPTTQAEAIVYDLHFVRRYVPPNDPVTFELLPDSANGSCVKVAGACDLNKHSFVVRTDGRAQSLTPPGFDRLPGFSTQ